MILGRIAKARKSGKSTTNYW